MFLYFKDFESLISPVKSRSQVCHRYFDVLDPSGLQLLKERMMEAGFELAEEPRQQQYISSREMNVIQCVSYVRSI